MDADPKAYAAVSRSPSSRKRRPHRLFQAETRQESRRYTWNDPPLDPSWTTPDATLTAKIESAQGMLTERFAFCQTMPLDEFVKVAEALRPVGLSSHSGSAPTPMARPSGWRRSGPEMGVPGEWLTISPPTRFASTDERNRKEGYLPVDVAGYLAAGGEEGKPTSRFAALWRGGPDPMTTHAWSWRHPPPNSRSSRTK